MNGFDITMGAGGGCDDTLERICSRGRYESNPKARNTDPSTSHEAAGKVNAAAIRDRMLEIIRAAGQVGVIWDDLRAAFPGVKETSISPRIKELEDAGRITRHGKRKGSSGVNQLICRVQGV